MTILSKLRVPLTRRLLLGSTVQKKGTMKHGAFE